ncbi:hypothetical protein VI817_002409 [Penicillium citrinum]|nr:hypothetical protein VI817_002409 [Penicillium citrinum]
MTSQVSRTTFETETLYGVKRVIWSSAEPWWEAIASKAASIDERRWLHSALGVPLAATSAELVCFRIANPDPLSLEGFRMDPALAWLRMDCGEDIVLSRSTT